MWYEILELTVSVEFFIPCRTGENQERKPGCMHLHAVEIGDTSKLIKPEE